MRSRSWLNLLFWIVLAICGTAWIALTWPKGLTPHLALIVSAAALWVNFFPRFIEGPRLVCTANQVTILAITTGNQLPVVIDIATSDVLSENPSSDAARLISTVPELGSACQRRSKPKIESWFQRNPPRQDFYVPTDELVRQFLSDARMTPSFFIPLSVYNSGSRYGEIGRILMVVELQSDPSKKWAYAAYVELDESKLIHINQATKDLDKLSAFFPGKAIGPNDSVRLDLCFTPHHRVANVQISNTNLIAGTYDLHIIGEDPRGRRIFGSVIRDYPLSEETLLTSFKNCQWTFHAGMDHAILKMMKLG